MSEKKNQKASLILEGMDSSDESVGQAPELSYRKYSRITPEMKEQLIFLIYVQKLTIKQAARRLKMNYSSAKFIFNQHRDQQLKANLKTENQLFCKHRELAQGEIPPVEIKFSIGGVVVGESKEFVSLSDLPKN